MKSKTPFLRFALTAALFGSTSPIVWAYTVEIDPAAAIPATHTQVFATEWNTDGSKEGWGAGQFTLESGAPISGILTGTETGNDPTLNLGGKSIRTSSDTIIEFKIKKQTADASRIDLFWGDDNGGIGHVAPVRIGSPPFLHDDQFHVVRITFGGSELNGKFSSFRLDPSADHTNNFVTTSLDYFRVYSVLPATADLSWDPGQTGGPAGGTGTWDTTHNFWWNGTTDVKWPSTSSASDSAVFGGTAGTVTIQAAGITAASLEFNTSDYSLAGGPLTLDGAAALRASGQLFLDAPLSGSANVSVVTGNVIFRTASTLNGTLQFKNDRVASTVNNPFGNAYVILGAGGNIFLSAVAQPLTFNNDFEYHGNRLIIDNNTYNQGTDTYGVTIGGGLYLASTSPGDIFLRRNLTVNGEVTGSGANGKSLYFAGDSGTMTLNSPTNSFTGDIVFDTSTRLVFTDDTSLGASYNNLIFNGGQGTLQPMNSFTSSRSITVKGSTAAVIDSAAAVQWDGTIAGANGVNSRFYKDGSGTLVLNGTASLGGGTQVRGGVFKIPAGGSLTHGATWDNNHGVAGLATMQLEGGEFTINSSFYGVGNGINPADEALFKILGGTYTHVGGQLLVGFRGNGRFVMQGGIATINELAYGDGATDRTAISELNGGTIAFNAASRRDGEAAATILLNGATVQARRSEVDFLRSGVSGITHFYVSNDGAKFDTAGFDIGIRSPLAHNPTGAATDGGLTKTGVGSLFLEGAQTYNGPTSVLQGSFGGNGSLTSNVTTSAGLAVRVSQTGGVAGTDHSLLAITGTLTVANPLTIRILPGTGSFVENTAAGMTVVTASGGITGFNQANVIFDTSSFTGNGTFSATQSGNSIVLGYTAGAAGGYAGFASTINDADRRGKLDDADNDGISNLLEYVLGGNPNAADPDILPIQTLSANNLTLNFNISPASAVDTAVSLQLSTDLLDWSSIPAIPVAGTGPKSVQVPRNSRAKLFARVVATNQ